MRNLIVISWITCLLPAIAADVPLTELVAWNHLAYSGIPPNEVSVGDGEMVISVSGSASPLVYGFDEPTMITGITVLARYSGGLRIPDNVRQGDQGADDFVLKVGIVESFERTLNWIERRLMADWIRTLHDLAPEGSGIKRINFLSTTQSESLVGSSRTHPLSDLLYEQRLVHVDGPGVFRISHRLPEAVEALGLWLSSDGDNTGSSFEVRIERITLQTH